MGHSHAADEGAVLVHGWERRLSGPGIGEAAGEAVSLQKEDLQRRPVALATPRRGQRACR